MEATEMVFKSEEDRLAAVNELAEVPPSDIGIANHEEWQMKQDELADKIATAKIDPDYVPGEKTGSDVDGAGQKLDKPAVEDAAGDDWYKAEDWTFNFKGENVTIAKEDLPSEPEDRQKFTFKNAKDAFNGLVHTQRYLQTTKQNHSQSVADYKKELDTLREKNTELETSLENAKSTTQTKLPDGIPTDTDLSSLQNQLDDMDKEIDGLEGG